MSDAFFYALGMLIPDASGFFLVTVPFWGQERLKRSRIFFLIASLVLTRAATAYVIFEFIPDGAAWNGYLYVVYVLVLLGAYLVCYKVHLAKILYTMLILILTVAMVNYLAFIINAFIYVDTLFVFATLGNAITVTILWAFILPFGYRVCKYFFRSAFDLLSNKSIFLLCVVPATFFVLLNVYVFVFTTVEMNRTLEILFDVCIMTTCTVSCYMNIRMVLSTANYIQNEKKLSDEKEMLENLNRAQTEFYGNIGHDLKTPLSVLSVNLEKLGQMSQNLDAEYQRHVNIAYHKNLDMQRLLQNLFEVNRIESGCGMYEPKWLSLNGLLADIQQKYGEYLDDKGIDLSVSGGGDAEISADPQKIWSVFDNIIYNAVRYTGKNGNITVTAENQSDCVGISITDTGCGIAPQHLPHIFERFYKGSTARGGTEGDSGLGLYIVKSIMEGVGGGVSAESEVGKGTTIHLSFVRKRV